MAEHKKNKIMQIICEFSKWTTIDLESKKYNNDVRNEI